MILSSKSPCRTGAVGAAAAVLLAVVLAACDGGGGAATSSDPVEPASTSTTLPVGSGGEVLTDLLARAAGSRDETFTVTYDLYAPDLTGGDTGALTMAQDPPREASRFIADGERSGVQFIDRNGEVVACALSGGQWRCYSGIGNFREAPAVLDYGDLLRVLDAYRANQRWFDFTSDEREVAGRATRCVVGSGHDDMPAEVAKRTGTQVSVCIDTSTGVPLLVEITAADGGELRFRADAVKFSTRADSSVMVPPAEVEAGPPNVTIPVPVTTAAQ